MKQKNRIILASSSPRRKELLNQIGLDFKVVESKYEQRVYILTQTHITT